jgi:hypothetical protein
MHYLAARVTQAKPCERCVHSLGHPVAVTVNLLIETCASPRSEGLRQMHHNVSSGAILVMTALSKGSGI